MKTTVQHPFPTRDALHTLIAAIPGVIYQFKVQSDGAWQFLYLSPGIETLYEVSPEAAYADPDALTRCIVPEDRPGHRAAVELASHTLTAWFHEHQIQTPKGQRKWVRGQATPHPQPDGSVLWYGILTDITEQKQAEAALRDREAQYRRLMEHLHAGVVVHAPDTRILLANTQATRFLGLSLDQMQGKTARDPAWSFVREDETPMPLDEYPVNRVRTTRQPLRNLTVGINRPDRGDRVWVLVNAFPEQDADGNLCQIVVTFIDFTEHTRMEKVLRESEERLAWVLRGTNDGFWDWDLVRNTLYYSPRWWAMLGYADGELPDDPDLWRRLMHPDDLESVNRVFAAALANGTRDYQVEFRLRHKDGHEVWAFSRGFIQRDAQGQAIRVSGANTDITERKQQEELLKLSEARYKAIVEGQTDLVCRYLPNGTLTFVNDAYCRYFDRSAADLLAHSILLFIPEEDQAIAPLAHCDADHPLVINEHRVVRGDGAARWMQWTNQAILDDDGTLIEVQAVGRDVTEQRQTEAALRESERLNTTILNSLSESIAVLDAHGVIRKVNTAWERFAEDNGATEGVRHPVGFSYRKICFSAAEPSGATSALVAWTGIEAVMTGARDHFTLEYPCDSPGRSLWFRMSVYPLVTLQGGVVIAHENITERKRLEVALQAMATTDDLTGLANRRHFLARLAEERDRLQRQDTQRAVVLMLDLDHFKAINDTCGHAAGDSVLRHCAALMRDSLRKIDQVGRIGGEEFAILLSGADRVAAQVFAERLRQKVADTPIMYEGRPILVSIGIAALTAQDATVDMALSRADAALYRAKAEGRNRVVMADE